MTDSAMEHAYRQFDRLNRRQKLSILHRLIDEVGDSSRQRTGSILEIRGVGKHLWSGVDAQEYVDGERNEWK